MPKTYAIGDVHGCNDLLQLLLQAINPKAEDTVIFLGDLIDRGNDSKRVLDSIMALSQQCQTIVIKGNHEEMMLNSFHSERDLRFFLTYGGSETLASFGVSPCEQGLLSIPEKYIRFLENSLPYHETENFIFTHGTPFHDIAMPKQSIEGLRWRKIGSKSKNYAHNSGKTIICGHTAQKNGDILQTEGLICIDTYAYGGYNLTALEVSSMNYWQVSIDFKVHQKQL